MRENEHPKIRSERHDYDVLAMSRASGGLAEMFWKKEEEVEKLTKEREAAEERTAAVEKQLQQEKDAHLATMQELAAMKAEKMSIEQAWRNSRTSTWPHRSSGSRRKPLPRRSMLARSKNLPA